MSIKVEFFPHVLFQTSSKDNFNKDTVYEIVGGFGEEASKLSGRDILIFFGMRSRRYQIGLGAWGVLAIKNTPSYLHFLETYNYELSPIPNISNFEFIIYLSDDIRENDNKFFKTFTIAHELQHIIQYVDSKNSYKKHLLLFRYFYFKNEMNNQRYRNLPSEIDSFKKAKAITYNLFEKEECDQFLEEESIRGNTNNDNDKKSYWENIKAIDLNSSYDYEEENNKLWNECENAIENEIARIENQNKINPKEKDLLEAYRYFKNN